MRRELPIPHPAESRRYPPLGKRILVAHTGSARATVAADVAEQLATEVGGRCEVVPVPGATSADELLSIATHRRATLVVLPLGGTVDLAAIAEQDMALQAVHRACVPVLAVGADLDRPPRRALLAIDFSDASSRAASAAMRLLAGDGSATLVHVYPDRAADATDWNELLARGARRRLDLMQRRLGAARGRVDVVLAHGDPAHQILGRATVARADLIALGGGSRGILHRMLASSLTTRIVRGATCSVLVAPEVERSSLGRTSRARRHRDRA